MAVASAAESGVGETARIWKPATRASSAVSGPIHTEGIERTSSDSARARATRPRTVEPLVSATAASGPSETARRSRARELSGPSCVQYAITSSTSAPLARNLMASSSSARAPRTTTIRSPATTGSSPDIAMPLLWLGWNSTSMPSSSRTRRVAGPIAANFDVSRAVNTRSAALSTARAPFALVMTTHA